MRGPTVTFDVSPPYTEAGSQLNVQARVMFTPHRLGKLAEGEES